MNNQQSKPPITVVGFCNIECCGVMLQNGGKTFATVSKNHTDTKWVFRTKVKLPRYLGGKEVEHEEILPYFSNQKVFLLKKVEEANCKVRLPFLTDIEKYHTVRLQKQLFKIQDGSMTIISLK